MLSARLSSDKYQFGMSLIWHNQGSNPWFPTHEAIQRASRFDHPAQYPLCTIYTNIETSEGESHRKLWGEAVTIWVGQPKWDLSYCSDIDQGLLA